MGKPNKRTILNRLICKRRLAGLYKKKEAVLPETTPVPTTCSPNVTEGLEFGGTRNSECFVKTEADAVGSNRQTSPEPDKIMIQYSDTQERDYNKCILCNKKTKHSGIQLHGLNGNEYYGVMFLLLKMLKVPSEKLKILLPIYDKPTNWVSSCDACTVAIQSAFTIERQIEGLEKKLRKLQKEFQTKISSSWKRATKFGNKISNEVKEQPVSLYVRKYVAIGEWDADISKSPDESLELKPEVCKLEPVDNEESFSFQDAEFSEHSVPGDILTVEETDNCIGDLDNVAYAPENPPQEPTCSSSLASALTSIIVKERKRQRRKLDLLQKFSCKMCPTIEPMATQTFAQHILYHKRRPYKCRICGNYLTGKPQELDNQPEKLSSLVLDPMLRDHRCSEDTMEKVSFETHPIWSCHHCSERFVTEDLRDSHGESCANRTWMSEPARKCTTCSKVFWKFSEWSLHRALEHPDIAELSCFRCGAMFRKESSDLTEKFILDRAALQLHSSKCPESTPGHCRSLPECEFCGEIFLTVSRLGNHLEKCHFVSKQLRHVCRLCFARKPNDTFLAGHMKTHTNYEPKVCDICGYSSTVNTRFADHNLHKHGIRSTKSTTHKCAHEGCPFEAYTKGRVTIHKQKVHGEARQYKCQHCGKEFFQKNKLNLHEMIHTNKLSKPYQCELCGNSFAVKTYLYIHMRLSHQNRPFASTHKKPSRPRKGKVSLARNPTNVTAQAPPPDSHNELQPSSK